MRSASAGLPDDADYFVSYGDPAAGPAPADRNRVYLFFDDFEAGSLARWR
ncbi:MAG: hypothetical protein JXR83_09860 [Deltaproteobacteria bacterium]|nr:hypothetical protein [Deltaproteobacteria bacterium]